MPSSPTWCRGGGSHLLPQRELTLSERIALVMREEHAERLRPQERPQPSRPRRFSWEGEG